MPVSLRRLWLAYLDGPHAAGTRATFRAGVVAAAVLNAQGGLKGGKPAKAEHFFPALRRVLGGRPRRRQSDGSIILAMQAWAAVSGGGGEGLGGDDRRTGRLAQRGKSSQA